MEVVTKSAKATQKLGEKIANKLSAKSFGLKTGNATILALTGNLGSGKTTFVQGLVKGLGIKQRIISPTFIILREYELKAKSFYHVDLYRLEGDLGNELKNLGIDALLNDKSSIVVIEWAEKMKDFLPKSTIWIKFENLGEDKRKISIDLK